jgi:RNA polymerase sigma factor (sigma-70 family)
MTGLARILLRNARARIEPEDLVQTVLTEIYAKLEAGADIKNPVAYANMSIKNRALDEIRRFHNRYEHAWPSEPDSGAAWEPPDRAAMDAERDPIVRDVLARLEPEKACFLWRVVFEQRSVHDAAEQCGWPEKSPYFHYKKLLDQIRPMVGLEPR